MLSNYVTLFIFALFSIFVPAAMLLASKVLGPEEEHNPIKDSNYESAEIPIGRETSIMHEYLHYFTIFVAFEITLAFALLWAFTARAVGYWQDIIISILFVFSTLLAIISIALAKVK
ncbi:MAG: NADH-quinone oxidoreductase subunit A [Candidatus Micrarchaeia archaeon]